MFMKKVLSIIFLLLTVATTLHAQTFSVANADGVNINYSVLSATDQTVEVASSSYSGRVIVPDTVVYNDITWTVTSVGTAFQGTSVTMVGLPSTVTALVSGAFKNCPMLDTLFLSSIEPVVPPKRAGFYYPSLIFVNSNDATLSIGTVIVVPCGSLKAYRNANWNSLPSLTSTCAVPITVSVTEDSVYRVDSIFVAGEQGIHFSNLSYEIGDTAIIGAQRWYEKDPVHYWMTRYPRYGFFMGWSNGCTELSDRFVVTQADTITCYVGTVSSATLAGANFTMPVGVFGNMSYDGNHAGHRVATDSTATIFASSLWLAADSIHVAAQKFMGNGNDFLPGPLHTDATIDLETAFAYNRVWHVTREQIDYHIANCGTAGYEPEDDIVSWPGNNPFGYDGQLAPYYDADSNGSYNALAGDYPIIRGDEAVFSIFNDACRHFESGSPETIGVEVHCMTYAFHDNDDDALRNTIFAHYDIYNRSANSYDSLYLGAWTDFDLGNAYDDYVGSDAGRSMYYAYNGLENDSPGDGSFVGVPPAQSCTFLEGNMGSFLYYNNSSSDMISGEPNKASDYNNYLHSRWKNGRHLKFGGNGVSGWGATESDANYMFCGTTDTAFPGENWTELLAGNAPSDRRGLGASGPYQLASGGVVQLDLAYTTAFGQDSAWGSVVALQALTDEVRRQWQHDTTDSGKPFVYMPYSAPHEVGVEEAIAESIAVYPNPTTGTLNVRLGNVGTQSVQLFDMMGRMVMQAEVMGGCAMLQLAPLPQGIYILRAGGAVQRILKQ